MLLVLPQDTQDNVNIQVFEEFQDLDLESWLRYVASCTLSIERESQPESLSVVIADGDTVRELNRVHRGLDEHTDVLAFSFEHEGEYYGDDRPSQFDSTNDPFILPPETSETLGEVIISYPQAERQANESKRTIRQELAALLAHGILHLLGYDHMEPEDEKRMKAREGDVLALVMRDE